MTNEENKELQEQLNNLCDSFSGYFNGVYNNLCEEKGVEKLEIDSMVDLMNKLDEGISPTIGDMVEKRFGQPNKQKFDLATFGGCKDYGRSIGIDPFSSEGFEWEGEKYIYLRCEQEMYYFFQGEASGEVMLMQDEIMDIIKEYKS